ncbi:chloride channel protein [Candidatus Binatia bacterium]|nr:chloride channel protein [Candidatus Binatia bacterium]
MSQRSTAATYDALPVAPSLDLAVPRRQRLVASRLLFVTGVAIVVGLLAGSTAQVLTALIGLVTNLAFYGRGSFAMVSPADNALGLLVIVVPVLGGLVVGLMARFGSNAIRGHGIPEAMEQVLLNRSRIPPRITFLKPLSAAVAIGTGGPFGAEGPIIATGGALGSLLGQLLHITAHERKTLLAAGAAGGMAATFGSPVSAVLLAIELLLFEYKPRSLVPVALASVTATGVRAAFTGIGPVFAMPPLAAPSGEALVAYTVLGLAIGLAAVVITRAVYAIEDAFEKLPVHWMWWPALGAIVVGVVGYLVPHTLGVGYDNIERIVSGGILGWPLAVLCAAKLLSWSIALGSGTSGGTLAPLFTIGGALGALLVSAAASAFPAAGLDPRIGALVGMAAIFAGASRALLASVVFAFETTQQPMGLLPLLAGCSAAYLVSCLTMRNSIMTEKIVRRGTRVPGEYATDFLDQLLVRDHALREVVTLDADRALSDVRDWLRSDASGNAHQGFPVVSGDGTLLGVVTRRDLVNGSAGTADDTAATRLRVRDLLKRPPAVAFADSSLREAADHMVREDVGRLPVVERSDPRRVVGILTRSDLLAAHHRRLDEESTMERTLRARARS